MMNCNFDRTVLEPLIEASWSAAVITSPNASDGYAVQYVNPAFCFMTGYERDELIGKSLKILQGKDTDQRILDRLRGCLETGEIFVGRTFNYKKDGQRYLVEWKVLPVRNSENRIVNFVSVQQDLTELATWRAQGGYLTSTLEILADPVIIADDNFQSIFCNSAARKLLDCDERRPIWEALYNEQPDGSLSEVLTGIREQASRGEAFRVLLSHKGPNGNPILVDHTVSIVFDEQLKQRRLVFVGKDQAEALAREEMLVKQAQLDGLTGLFNRAYGEQLLEGVRSRTINRGKSLGLLMIDIDHFKEINDKFGHVVGDRALRSIAEALKQSVRPRDPVVRWGGEEFLIALENLDQQGAFELAGRVLESVSQIKDPLFGGVTASIGVGVLVSSESLEELITRVDAALYRAKNGGRNRVVQA